jgi:subtilisin family serine protease
VFREPSARNTSLLSSVLGAGELRNGRARDGTTLLRARLGREAPRIYERLGVAVADLDDDRIGRLQRLDSIAAVVPNSRCFVPAAAVAGRATEPSPRPVPPHSWCLDLIGVSPDLAHLGRGATVAVLDTGIDVDHPDLSKRVRENGQAASFVPGESVQDGHGHGTHCAGVVGGPRRSSSGTRYGVAPEVRLLVGKVLSDLGAGFTDWILEGIDWAAANGARAISLSCLSNRSAGEPHSVVYERVAKSLLESSPGTLLLAPAGNASARPWHTQPVDNPAACPSLVAVAAVRRARQVASFSGRQMDETGEVNLSAPGVGVHSAWTGGGFRSLSGTSMAVPHVAGVAALYLEERPTLSALELRHALEWRARPLGDSRDYGRGLVRAPGGPL